MPAAIAAGVFDNVEIILFQYGYETKGYSCHTMLGDTGWLTDYR